MFKLNIYFFIRLCKVAIIYLIIKKKMKLDIANKIATKINL